MSAAGRHASTILPQSDHVGAPALAAFARAKRVELVEEQHAHRKDGAQLDHHEEHVHEFLADVQLNELVHQDHVARARDGQPLGDALDQAEKCRFEQFDGIQQSLPYRDLPALDRAGRRLCLQAIIDQRKDPRRVDGLRSRKHKNDWGGRGYNVRK